MPRPVPHDHRFGQHVKRPGESKTWWVLGITLLTMIVEVVCGILFGSMALLADGIHMFSHAAAMFIAGMAYFLTRTYAHDPRFSFGTGKMNALAGFSSAVLLFLLGLGTFGESIHRLFLPQPILFDAAIYVAVGGLVINGICALILQEEHSHSHDHAHNHTLEDGNHTHGHDHNLRAAYVHVLTDALTSVLAIIALLAGKYLGWIWLDAAMGILGGIVICRWSVILIRSSGKILMDWEAPDAMREQVEAAIASCGQVTDLHVWSIGPGIYSATITLNSATVITPEDVRKRIPEALGIVHTTIEIHGANELPERTGPIA